MARTIAADAPEAIATARFIRMSPTKVRQVVDLIRGRHVDDARRVLAFTQRSATTSVRKVLESAIANAEHNRGLAEDELFVVRTWVDEGPTLRRYRPRAMGRATRIRKRTCHISVVVGRPEEPPEPVPEPERKKTTAKKTTRKSTAKKTTAKKTTAKKSTARKSTAKKTTGKKKTTSKKTTTRRKSDTTEEEA
jgi:large subunit ribosomal protein L22